MNTDIDRNKRELKNIFIYYKRLYKLNTALNLGKTWHSYFDEGNNSINIDCLLFFSNNILLVKVLLHEIGHALDFKYNKKQMEKEKREILKDEVAKALYVKNEEYHDSLPFEKRAINFAEKELHKWIGVNYDKH